MMLGIAAKISIKKLKGVRSALLTISFKKTATPMLTGKASNSARTDDTTVPKINGNAPNFSFTGSHSFEKINFHPNASRASIES